MITVRRSTETGLEIVEDRTKGCWIDVTNPTPDEVKTLPQDLAVPLEFISVALKRHETPHIEKADGTLLIVVHIPYFQDAKVSIPYLTAPMGIIVKEEMVVTLCQHEHDLLRHLSHEHQVDLSTAKPARFVLHLLWSVANHYIHYVSEINETVEALEDQLQRSLQNREVLELLRYQKSLVHFTTSLRANETMLERLHRSKALEMESKDEDLLDDVFTEHQQAIGMSEIASDILSQMMDAFASIISNNLNVVMKFLASVAVIAIIPTVIASFYGMNVRLPFEDDASAFLLLVGLSILGALVVGLIFWKRNWL